MSQVERLKLLEEATFSRSPPSLLELPLLIRLLAMGGRYGGRLPLISYDQKLSSVSIINLACHYFLYTVGKNVISNAVPSLPIGSNSPTLGEIVN